MSNNCNDIAKILLTDGTDQSQRNETALDPESLKIHGFGMEEWMKFAANFASHLNFYNTNNATTPDGNWQDFFTKEEDITAFITSLEKAKNVTPHLTLFVCFLKLLELPNRRMNALTKRHLDYYYQEVLQIEKLPATYDKVHLLFELSKAFSTQLFKKGLKFNGGKDSLGKLRVYELIEEFAASKATIASMKNFYMAPSGAKNGGNTLPYVKAAGMVQTTNGIDEPLPEGQNEWYPFGYDHNDTAINNQIFDEIPNAKLGFTIASETLLLKQGDRYIEIVLKLANGGANVATTTQELINSISVQYTGTKKWRLLESADGKSLKAQEETNSEGQLEANHGFKTEYSSNGTIRLFMELKSDIKETANYDPKIHGFSYNTKKPMFRFLFDTSTSEGVNLFHKLNRAITAVHVNVNVQNMRDVTLENDRGSINPTKPMFPFTTTPVQGSSFSVSNDEILSKKWTRIDVRTEWINAPNNFAEHYAVYDQNFINGLSVSAYEDVLANQRLYTEDNEGNKTYKTSETALVPKNSYQTSQKGGGIATVDFSYLSFKATVGVRNNGRWNSKEGTQVSIFEKRTDDGYSSNFHVLRTNPAYNINEEDRVEKIRLKLESSFYHNLYPRLYAVAVSSTLTDTTLPNEPYTPFAEEVVVSYTATDTIDFVGLGSIDEYEELRSQLFHEHPFGQTEEHKVLAEEVSFLSATEKISTLLPSYSAGGEFYIGLKNAEEYQTIPLLFQVSEGTENTVIDSFGEDEGISWQVLSNNHWKEFDTTEVIKNEVDNFLKSGIVSLKMPPEITQNNTLLPSGHTWIRASLKNKRYDIVCKFIGIHSQVALAQFTDNENDTSHLETGIEAGTIAKLIQRSSSVKSITQPYNSFGGSLEEDDKSYYRRVSERLRHKKRAVTMWDYENMVLQEFTDIFRVKCLSHTNLKSFNSAGSVTMVVIPDTVNKNVFNIYEPRVSTAYLNDIKTFLKRYTSPHVCLKVLNPDYEAIKIETSVRFNEGFDDSVYKSVLSDDLTKLLAPWAFDETKEIQFGGKLQKSMLINYIENLEYIDYITKIQIFVVADDKSVQEVPNYTATSPLTIMVSALTHVVRIAAKPCLEEINTNSPAHCE